MRTTFLFTPALLLAISQTLIQGQTIIQHLGAKDPVTEGFVMTYYPDAQLFPVFADLGFDAWSIGTDLDSGAYYDYYLSSNEQERVESQGWILATRLRIAEPSEHAGLLSVFTGTLAYFLSFSENLNGDPVIDFAFGSYTIEGTSNDYHEFRLEYDSASEMAALWIDGVERVSNIPPIPLETEARLFFGTGESNARTHWNEVTLTAIPEPAVVSLFVGCGTLLLVMYRRRRP